MALETTLTTAASTRRALLAGSLGALVAYLAKALGRPLAVRAEDEPILVGGEYTTATSSTLIANTANGSDVFRAESSTGRAIYGIGSIGVRGDSTLGRGVFGVSNSGSGV
jgi:hypothetical protein